MPRDAYGKIQYSPKTAKRAKDDVYGKIQYNPNKAKRRRKSEPEQMPQITLHKGPTGRKTRAEQIAATRKWSSKLSSLK